MKVGSFDKVLRIVSIFIVLVFGILLIITWFSSSDEQDFSEGKSGFKQDIEKICAFSPENGKRDWRRIILHHSGQAGDSIESITRYYIKNGYDNLPFHFFIDTDGIIRKTVSWQKQKKCKQVDDKYMNEVSIGICVIGDFSIEGNVPSRPQMQSLIDLINCLMKKFSIKKRYIDFHSGIEETECPGDYFPRKSLLRSLY